MTAKDIETIRTFVAQIDATHEVLQDIIKALVEATEPIFALVAALATDSPLGNELEEVLTAIENLDDAGAMLEMHEILALLTTAMTDEEVSL